jgi:hypothetical protein
MNVPVLIVAIITLIAFVAHVFGGTRETATIAPKEDDRLVASWVQAMCAFQMLAVDLLALALLLFAIVFWDLGPGESLILQLASGLYFLWGVVWVVQVLWLKKPSVTLLRLPHWIIWLLCSSLLFFGS